MNESEKESLDKEWIELILLAFKMGITLKEIREFLTQTSAGPK
ncbi:anti-repressor SinI family protein [Cytobacillus solani]|nr:anti-repressor SinI family protein [Cytobacillus solani]USK56551.1 anti-repressor SinI family protein [Cytobacillus solani]